MIMKCNQILQMTQQQCCHDKCKICCDLIAYISVITNQYLGYPILGYDARSQGITSHGIDLVIPEYHCFSNTKAKVNFNNSWNEMQINVSSN